MARGNTDLTSNEYDSFLSSKAKEGNNDARRELIQRKIDRKKAHDSSGVGYHFGLGDQVVKVERKEDLRKELAKRGLMLEVDVKKNLR